MKMSFANQQAPLVVDVIKETTVRKCIAAMRNGEYAGAMGHDLHISCIEESERTEEKLRSIIEASRRPVLALNYNGTAEGTYFTTTEEERIALLERAARAGASAVDMQAYSFDLPTKEAFLDKEYVTEDMLFAKTNPCEVALKPEIVNKQKEFIRRMHENGTEVLLSCHPRVSMNCAQVVSLAKELASRGPDIVKIVTMCENEEQLAEAFKTMLVLKKEITDCKIHFHCSGPCGKLTRIVNPMLGAYLVFCNERFTQASDFEQVQLKAMADTLRLLDWRM